MCSGSSAHREGDEDDTSNDNAYRQWGWRESDIPPDWENVELPPDHILRHLTDAHCHPTDLDITASEYTKVSLGGIAGMGTTVEDQDKVMRLGEERGWNEGDLRCGRDVKGVRVVSCFGYHPWFTHRYTLLDSPPSKEQHYTSLFFNNKPQTGKNWTILQTILPYLPDPIPFKPLLEGLRNNVLKAKNEERLTMVGEVGLDGGARMRWPVEARSLYEERYSRQSGNTEDQAKNLNLEKDNGEGHDWETEEEEEEEEWKRLTPFKVPIDYQKAIVLAQMEIAIECGVNVSFHSVAAAGPTMEVLTTLRDKHRNRFTNRIKVDLHSAGGWSPQFWKQAENNLLNLYASPSIFITSRSRTAPDLIKAISKDRILVESDSHDVRIMTRAVWSAVRWIGSCKNWRIEGIDGDEEDWSWSSIDNDDDFEGVLDRRKVEEEEGKKEIWTVRTFERNWARFMGLIDEV